MNSNVARATNFDQSQSAQDHQPVRDLLTAALNKNQVTFSQVAKTAEQLSNGALKLKTDPMNKQFVFEYMNKKVYIDLNALRIGGLKYLNNILIDSILTRGDLDAVYEILDQVKEELLNKADKVHTHDISDVNNLRSTLNGKAEKVHTHAISDVNNLRSTLNGKADKVHNHSISDVNNLRSTLNGKAEKVHTHAISDVNNLQSTLNGKAEKVHNHSISDITNYTPFNDSALWNAISQKLDKSTVTDTVQYDANSSFTVQNIKVDGTITTGTRENDFTFTILTSGWRKVQVYVDNILIGSILSASMTSTSDKLLISDDNNNTIIYKSPDEDYSVYLSIDTFDGANTVHSNTYKVIKTTIKDFESIYYNIPTVKLVLDLYSKIGSQEYDDKYLVSLVATKSDANHNHDERYSIIGHEHNITDTVGLETTLDNKAALTHTHTTSEITDLQSTLNGKVDKTKITTYYRTATRSIRWGRTNYYSYDIIGYIKPVYRSYTQIAGDIQATVTTTWASISEKFEVKLTYAAGGGANKDFTLSGNSIISNDKGKSAIVINPVDDNKTAYSIAIVIGGYTGNDSCGYSIVVRMPEMLKIYSDSACSTEQSTSKYNTSQSAYGFGHISKDSLAYSSIYWNEESRALKTHTHSISDINNLQTTLEGKANTTHTHSISEVNELQSTLIELEELIYDTSNELDRLNSKTKIYKTGSGYRHYVPLETLVYITLGYIENDQGPYPGFVAKFEITCAATNNNDDTVFETDEICIGHIMEDEKSSTTKIGISSCYRKISARVGKLGLGLVDVNGDNTVYRIDLLVSDYNVYNRQVYNIICNMNEPSMLFYDVACTKPKPFSYDLDWGIAIQDFSAYQSYSLSDKHKHVLSDIEDYALYDDADIRAAIESLKTSKAEKVHNHSISDINDLQSTLNGKAEKVHKHSISDINDLQSTLNGKAEKVHKHSISDINDLQSTLNGKANLTHTHSIADVNNLQSTLNDLHISTTKATIDLLYPIGSIYTSMNNINPSKFLGGTWEQIVDKFMYCSNTSLVEGGSQKITVDNLPPHSHSIAVPNNTIGFPEGAGNSAPEVPNTWYWRGTHASTTAPTGSGTDYMPPYITMFAWYRTG